MMKKKTKRPIPSSLFNYNQINLKKGDKVKVIVGDNKNETGFVNFFDRKTGKVFVSGVNLVRRAVKKTENNPGGFVPKIQGIHVSNLVFIDSEEKEIKISNIPDRINKSEKIA